MARPYWVVCRAAQIAVSVVRIGLGIFVMVVNRLTSDERCDFVVGPVRQVRSNALTWDYASGLFRSERSRFYTAGLENL